MITLQFWKPGKHQGNFMIKLNPKFFKLIAIDKTKFVNQSSN